jgi:hypothetical protein
LADFEYCPFLPTVCFAAGPLEVGALSSPMSGLSL